MTTALPAGFAAEPWDEDGTRCITGPAHALPGNPDVRVYATAVQGRDGHIDTTDQPPLAVVTGASGGLTAQQARALALRLLDVALELEGLP